MDTPLLFEANPVHPVVSRYVEKYQFYRIDRNCYLKTIPNGRMECWKIFSGGFEIWDDTTNSFSLAPKIGGYPATQNSLLFRITDQLFCINIKLKLSAILVPAFSNYYAIILNKQKESFQAIEDLEEITIADFFDGNTLYPVVLDDWIMGLFSAVLEDEKIEELILLLERQDIQSVAELAAVLKVSAKSLHRKIKRFFNLSPKELLSIVRFEKTAAYLNSEFANRLTDALRFGYYDQSHFNKESRRITGFSPKELFDRMCLSTHDLMLFDAEPV